MESGTREGCCFARRRQYLSALQTSTTTSRLAGARQGLTVQRVKWDPLAKALSVGFQLQEHGREGFAQTALRKSLSRYKAFAGFENLVAQSFGLFGILPDGQVSLLRGHA